MRNLLLATPAAIPRRVFTPSLERLTYEVRFARWRFHRDDKSGMPSRYAIAEDAPFDIISRWEAVKNSSGRRTGTASISPAPLERATIIVAHAFLRVCALTSTIFCAFGARRLVSRGELGWFLSSFAARAGVELVGGIARARTAELFERAIYGTVAFDTMVPVSPDHVFKEWRVFARGCAATVCGSMWQHVFEAVTYGGLVAAGVIHSVLVRYVDEADALSSLILGVACVRSIVLALNTYGDARRRLDWLSSMAPRMEKNSKSPVAISALINHTGELVAIVGDGNDALFDRVVRGVRDDRDVGVLLSRTVEWTVPEPLDKRVNASALGAASSRVDDFHRTRLCETLEGALCCSSRFVEYATSGESSRTVDDSASSALETTYACAIGIERARRLHARTILVEDPFHEATSASIRRRLIKNKLANRRRSCVFTTCEIGVLPACDRIVLCEGDDVVFIGDWVSMIRDCDAHSLHRAFMRINHRGNRVRKSRVRCPSLCEMKATVNILWKLDDLSRKLGVIASVSVAPALAISTFERWINGKRTDASNNVIALYAAIGALMISVAVNQALKRSYGNFPQARAFARVLFLAFAACLLMPDSSGSVLAFSAPIVIVWSSELIFGWRAAHTEVFNAHVRLSHFAARVSEGAEQIFVTRCEELYYEVLTHLLAKLRLLERRRASAETLRQLWCFILVFLTVALGLWALGDDEPSRRGVLAFLGVHALDVCVEFPSSRIAPSSQPSHEQRGTQTVDESISHLRRTSSSYL